MPHYTQYSTIIQLMAINFHSWTKPFKWTLQDWSMCHHQIVFTSLQALINIFYTLMRLCLVILMNSEQAIFCIITSVNVENPCIEATTLHSFSVSCLKWLALAKGACESFIKIPSKVSFKNMNY